jgi:hypothetical protein
VLFFLDFFPTEMELAFGIHVVDLPTSELPNNGSGTKAFLTNVVSPDVILMGSGGMGNALANGGSLFITIFSLIPLNDACTVR